MVSSDSTARDVPDLRCPEARAPWGPLRSCPSARSRIVIGGLGPTAGSRGDAIGGGPPATACVPSAGARYLTDHGLEVRTTESVRYARRLGGFTR